MPAKITPPLAYRRAAEAAAAILGIAIILFLMLNTSSRMMRSPMGLQVATLCYLMAAPMLLLYPIFRSTVQLDRIDKKWKLVARGAYAAFFVTLALLLTYARADAQGRKLSACVPIETINGIAAAGDRIPVPRRVHLTGALEYFDDGVRIRWRRSGTSVWSRPVEADVKAAGWEATLEFATPGENYEVIAALESAATDQCAQCPVLQIEIIAPSANFKPAVVDGSQVQLSGTAKDVLDPLELHLFEQDSQSSQDDGPIDANAGTWSSVRELRAPYHFPTAVTYFLNAVPKGRQAGTIRLAEMQVTIPTPDLRIRTINGSTADGKAGCVVAQNAPVRMEVVASNLVNEEQVWIRSKALDALGGLLEERRAAAKKVAPMLWLAELQIGAGRSITLEAMLSDGDPGNNSEALSSRVVNCRAVRR